jgi:hypothetical protein
MPFFPKGVSFDPEAGAKAKCRLFLAVFEDGRLTRGNIQAAAYDGNSFWLDTQRRFGPLKFNIRTRFPACVNGSKFESDAFFVSRDPREVEEWANRRLRAIRDTLQLSRTQAIVRLQLAEKLLKESDDLLAGSFDDEGDAC